MKTSRAWAALVAVVAVGAAWGQTIDYVIVAKQRKLEQTGATTTVNPSNGNLWGFEAQVVGSGQSLSYPSEALTLFRPGASTPDSFVFLSDKGQWKIEGAYGTKTALDTAFPNGDYVLGIGGANHTLTLTGDLYPNPPGSPPTVPPPLAVISVGTWAGGGASLLRVTAAEAATGFNFGTNTFVDFVGGGTHRIDLFVSGYGGATYSQSANTTDADNLTMAIPGGALSPGSQYRFEIDFTRIIELENTTELGAATMAGTVYTKITSFTVEVIPEPATVATWIGALALAGAVAVRRRGGPRVHSPSSR